MSLGIYVEANDTSIDFLIRALDDFPAKVYKAVATPAFQSSIGAHYRHIIEHYQCFFAQLSEKATINYDKRERNLRLETDMKYCREQLQQIKNNIASFNCQNEQGQPHKLLVQDDHSCHEIHSSIHRELMFLIGHTEHHSAMIAAMLRLLGYPVDQQFGVANATLNFQRTLEKRA